MNPAKQSIISAFAGLRELISAVYTVKEGLQHVACSLQDWTESDEAHNGQYKVALIG